MHDWVELVLGVAGLLIVARFFIWPLRGRILRGVDKVIGERVQHEPQGLSCDVTGCRQPPTQPRPYIAERNRNWAVITPPRFFLAVFEVNSPKLCEPHFDRVCADLGATVLEFHDTTAKSRAVEAARVREENAGIAQKLAVEDKVTIAALAQKFGAVEQGIESAPHRGRMLPAPSKPIIVVQGEDVES